MGGNRIKKLKSRLSSVIDWRVREAYAEERKIVADLSQSMTRYSVGFTDHIAELTRQIEALESRLAALESRSESNQ